MSAVSTGERRSGSTLSTPLRVSRKTHPALEFIKATTAIRGRRPAAGLIPRRGGGDESTPGFYLPISAGARGILGRAGCSRRIAVTPLFSPSTEKRLLGPFEEYRRKKLNPLRTGSLNNTRMTALRIFGLTFLLVILQQVIAHRKKKKKKKGFAKCKVGDGSKFAWQSRGKV